MAQVPPSEWHPNHKLEKVTLTLRWLDDGTTELRAEGWATTKVRRLWVYGEDFDAGAHDMAPHDVAAHILLCCHQDKPNTMDRLLFSLRGGLLWEDQELPFS